MKKRFVSCMIVGMLAAVFLGGCNDPETNMSRKNSTELSGEPIGNVTNVDESEEDNRQVVKRTAKASIEDIQAENLTNTLDTEICIDYYIQTYDPVQSFSYKLFAQNMEEDNPVLSPVSAYLALGMAGNGAKGETLEEFYALLGDDLACMPNHLMTTLPREKEGMTISLANSAWVDDNLNPEEDFLISIDSFFKSEVYRTNLSETQAMKDMNTWINYHTNALIPKLLEEPLAEEDRLALFNTIYFKGDWANKFEANSTMEKDFVTESGETVKVDMMQMYHENQLYVKNNVAEGVILPYQDENMAFVALKPVGERTVREMYEQLTWEDISGFLAQEERTLCNLQLPKFEVTYTKILNDSLKNMGLEKAFESETADFTGLGTSTDGGNLFISLVQQKAVVIVDEEGTEAAAVTEVVFTRESAMEPVNPPVDIFFNEPFLYMVVDMEKEIPLFMGIMDNPNIE